MDRWISVKDHLPDDGQKVRIRADGEHIATFRKGISEEDRRRMKSHEIVTRGDEIRHLADDELAFFLNQWGTSTRAWQKDQAETLYWLQQPAEEEDHGNQRDI